MEEKNKYKQFTKKEEIKNYYIIFGKFCQDQ